MNNKHKPLSPNEAYKADAEFARETQPLDQKKPKKDSAQSTEADKSKS